jgi:hypothetical protein
VRKEDLHNTLMHPENLSDEQLVQLRETVARFPFFGAAQIALTRAFKARGDIRFTDQLSQAAIYTGHRASLYQRLKAIKPTMAVHTGITQKEINATEETTLASLIIENEAFTPTASPEVAITVAAVQSKAPNQPLSVTEVVLEHSTAASESTESATDIKLIELDTLEAQILVSAIHTSIELEVQPEHSFEPHVPFQSAIDEEPIDENSYAALIYRRAQRKQLLPEEPTSFESTSEAEEDMKEDLPAFRSTPLSHGVQRIRSTDSKQHQRDLVDRFIHSEPQIARGKAGEYPSGNLAKESLEDDFSMITETMAVLFAKQGKLDKARKAFRKLMEQHPEKSVYFAAQLKNLEHFKK